MDILRDFISTFSGLLLPLVIIGFPLYGICRKVPVYESFVSGAREGFTTAVTIIPYLVAILFAVAMFRSSGAMGQIVDLIRPALDLVGFPPELLPMAIIRPLSGSASLGVLAENVQSYGRLSQVVAMSATIYGSTETTFYVLAVYFGAVGIRKTRHALATGLIADASAVLLAVVFVRLLLV